MVTLCTLEINVGLLIKDGTRKDEVLSWALLHYHDSSCGHGALDLISFASKFYYLIGSYSKVKLKSHIPVKWTPPPLGWFKLNTDGSSLGNPRLAGGGGVIRNHLGEWVGGFSRAIGFTTSVQQFRLN